MRQVIRRLRIWWLEFKIWRLERRASQIVSSMRGTRWDREDAEFAWQLYRLNTKAVGKYVYKVGGGRLLDFRHVDSTKLEIVVLNQDKNLATCCTEHGLTWRSLMPGE